MTEIACTLYVSVQGAGAIAQISTDVQARTGVIGGSVRPSELQMRSALFPLAQFSS